MAAKIRSRSFVMITSLVKTFLNVNTLLVDFDEILTI